jgi:signal transduction histidine kinase
MFRRIFNKFNLFSLSARFMENRSTVKRYGVPLILICLLILTNIFLHTLLTDIRSFRLLTLAVILSAWYGGFGPGIMATLITGFIDYFFFLGIQFPLLSFDRLFLTFIFLIVGFIISFITESLRQANQQKDNFLGFASHELKNPLAVIKGYAGVLEKKAEHKNAKEFADLAVKINQQTTNATMLIDDLLDITRIREGKITYRFEEFSIDALVKESIENQKKALNSHTIIFKKEGSAVHTVWADRGRMGQVLTNLISNAIKYSPNANKIIVTVKNRKTTVTISVKDFGIGITREAQKKIFQPFFRSNRAEASTKGLGVGLYIVQRIITQHKGKLLVESTLNKGSTFSVVLKIKH